MKVNVRQIKERWYCNFTYNGTDKYFEGETMDDAKHRVRDFLSSKGVEVEFSEPIYYVKDPPPYKGFKRPKLDNL